MQNTPTSSKGSPAPEAGAYFNWTQAAVEDRLKFIRTMEKAAHAAVFEPLMGHFCASEELDEVSIRRNEGIITMALDRALLRITVHCKVVVETLAKSLSAPKAPALYKVVVLVEDNKTNTWKKAPARDQVEIIHRDQYFHVQDQWRVGEDKVLVSTLDEYLDNSPPRDALIAGVRAAVALWVEAKRRPV